MMRDLWQLQEAKNKLSRVVDQAVDGGPQIITRRGVEVAVVISYSEYCKLKSGKQKLSSFFKSSPLAGISLSRDKSPWRNVDDFSS